MTWPANATTRAVAEELVATHKAERWRHSFVSWSLSDDCYFSVALSPRNPPIGGVAMPRVAERMYEIMQIIGIPIEDWPRGFRFQFLPLLSLPLGRLISKDEQTVRLSDEVHLDAERMARIVDFVCSARDEVREMAGTVDRALDFARDKMPWHPACFYVLPVGYRIVGRLQDCESYLADCRARPQNQSSPSFLTLYDQFAGQLRKETW